MGRRRPFIAGHLYKPPKARLSSQITKKNTWYLFVQKIAENQRLSKGRVCPDITAELIKKIMQNGVFA